MATICSYKNLIEVGSHVWDIEYCIDDRQTSFPILLFFIQGTLERIYLRKTRYRFLTSLYYPTFMIFIIKSIRKKHNT